MKRKLVSSILGVLASAAMVSTSFGQGQVLFKNYTQVGSTFVSAPVTFANIPGNGAFAGQTVGGNAWIANLLFSLNGGTTWSSAGTAPFLGSGPGDTTGGAGFFSSGGAVTIPGYTAGPVSFQVQAYNGADFASSAGKGQSAIFSLPSIATGTAPVGDLFNGETGNTFLQSFTVTLVPEPSTLALASLSAAFLAFRRRK